MTDYDKCMSFFVTKPLLLRCRKSSRLLMTSSTSRSSSLVTGGCLWGVRPLSASMDNGFPILDAFNDDQAFERHFGSFLDDASNQLPVSGSLSKSRPTTFLRIHEMLIIFQEDIVLASVEETLTKMRQQPWANTYCDIFSSILHSHI